MNDDLTMLENFVELVLKHDDSVSDIDLYYNLEGDYVVSYKQGGQKKLITIDYIEED